MTVQCISDIQNFFQSLWEAITDSVSWLGRKIVQLCSSIHRCPFAPGPLPNASGCRQQLFGRVSRFAATPDLGPFPPMDNESVLKLAAIVSRIDDDVRREEQPPSSGPIPKEQGKGTANNPAIIDDEDILDTTKSISYLSPLVAPVGSGWLNCRIVDEYLNLLQATAPQTICHLGSDFMTLLESHGFEHPTCQRQLAKFEDTLFHNGTLVVPYNKALHWTLLVARFQTVNGKVNVTVEHFDSMDQKKQRPAITLSKFLSKALEARGLQVGSRNVSCKPCPKQENALDCGVFTLFNARDIYQGQEPHTLQAANTPFARLELALALGTPLIQESI